jgi:hypothetical protein
MPLRTLTMSRRVLRKGRAGSCVAQQSNAAHMCCLRSQVSDCLFKDNRARGALLKSSNVLATRNVFDHTTGPAIKTETDGGMTGGSASDAS